MNLATERPPIEKWRPGVSCCDPAWEEAYRRFESPDEEIRKFTRRLLSLGASGWPRGSKIVELFCGRGNGLKALAALGFSSLSGVDLSEDLLRTYDGPAQLYVGDCRNLKLADDSQDVVIVQGGLHHLPELPADLEKTLLEIRRVLRPAGRFVMVEPWRTPFLRIVHAFCNLTIARRVWDKLDALATMIDRERTTYERWLNQSASILRLLETHFDPEIKEIAWGKLALVGRPRQHPPNGTDDKQYNK
jgi:ubiquinone/menaquinone biosynthesis C-methylase UbiE